MGNGKKYKSKRQLKKEGVVPQNKLKDMGLIKNAKWTDELGDRSWKEGPFRNRAVETWNGTKRVYKKGKEEGYDGDLWNLKKNKEDGDKFIKRKSHTVSYETGTPDEYEEKVTGIKIGKNIIAVKKDAAGLKYKETKKNKRKGVKRPIPDSFKLPKTISEKKGL